MRIRIARPTRDLALISDLYVRGLGWSALGSFTDHEGFDGVMVGDPKESFHLEFTSCRGHPTEPNPTVEDLLVLYIPDRTEWEVRCSAIEAAGFKPAEPFNPYWVGNGRTFVDADGYRLVVQNDLWP